MASSEQSEVNRRAQAADEAWLRVVIAFERTGALLVNSRTLIDASRSLLTTIAAKMTDAPVASSRALIDDSRRLLAALQNSDLPPARDPNSPPYPVAVSGGVLVNPAVRPSDPASTAYSAAFSIRVFEEEARFGWSLKSPLGEMLGEGTAETELKARSDAFCAGMAYMERLKRRSGPTDTSLH